MSERSASPASPHIIRLRGPWQYKVVGRYELLPDGTVAETTTDLPPGGQVTIPNDVAATLGPDFQGRVEYRRNFGLPTGLLPDDSVDLVVERVDAFGRVMLNDVLLGNIPAGGTAMRFPVRELLLPRNVLVIEVSFPIAPGQGKANRAVGGIIGEVRLEIFAAKS